MLENARAEVLSQPEMAPLAQQIGTFRYAPGGARIARTVIWLVSCAALAHLPGCAPLPRDPGSGVAAYVLTSVAGDSLPAVLFENEFGRRMILADTIWLHARGSGVRHAAIRWESSRPQGAQSDQNERADFRYSLADGKIEIQFRCGGMLSLALCAAPPHATGDLGNDVLRLTYLVSARSPLVYRRLQ